MKMLDGYKSYLGFVLYGIVGVLHGIGVLDEKMADVLFYVAEGLAGVGIAHKIAKGVAALKE